MKVLVIGGSGYIGSAVAAQLNADTVDLQWFDGPVPTYNIDYRELSSDTIANYSHIVLLAAHSSMAMCAGNWSSAWQNNVTNLSHLISKLDSWQTLIYASSGSVYGSIGLNCSEATELSPAIIEYDLTKQFGERIAQGARCKTIAIRLGTLSGFNTYARSDLMLNAMTISAKTEKKITVYNSNNHRSILGLKDCVNAISAMIHKPLSTQHNIFNLASFSGSILEFAQAAATILDVDLDIKTEATNNFSFELNVCKFENTYGFKFEETAGTIINSLAENYANIIWSPRIDKIQYV